MIPIIPVVNPEARIESFAYRLRRREANWATVARNRDKWKLRWRLFDCIDDQVMQMISISSLMSLWRSVRMKCALSDGLVDLLRSSINGAGKKELEPFHQPRTPPIYRVTVRLDENELHLNVMLFIALIVTVIKGSFTHIIGFGAAPGGCGGGSCVSTGLWSAWSSWSTCAFTYGGYSQARYRTCSAAVCVGGSYSEARPCVSYTKPAEWQEWSPWTECSVSCGGGTRSRHRICSTTCANCQCVGAVVEVQSCNSQPCCEFGPWSAWSECSVTCGTGGISYRTRQCSCMEGCVGPAREQKMCDAMQPCMTPSPAPKQKSQSLCVTCYLPTCILCTTYQTYPDGKRKRRSVPFS